MKEAKKGIRTAVKERIATLSDEQKAAAASAVAKILEQIEPLRTARCVALFASMPDEISTDGLIEKISQHAKIVLPRIEGDEMQFFAYDGVLKSGKFGIGEPDGKEAVSPSKIDVMVVPARAFTADGKRLGRGKGFYDKYLSHSDFHAFTIGIGYACQLFETLPCEQHDKCLDLVITA